MLILLTIPGFSALQAQDLEYTIQKGDTLYGIARQYKIDVKELQALNSLSDPSKIRVGQKIKIPGVSKDSNDLEWETYVVESGDTLYDISRKHAISLKTLLDQNNLSEKSLLKVGQKLKVPAILASSKPVPVKTAPSEVTKIDDPVVYSDAGKTVKPGMSAEDLLLPVQGELLSVDGKVPGVLIKAPLGTEIKAVSDGRISYVGLFTSFGRVILVQSNSGAIYIYGGNQTADFEPGQKISAGQILGTVGQISGYSDPCAFFTIWKSGKYLDIPKIAKI